MKSDCKTNCNLPWISIIIPIFNVKLYLERCLKSILTQLLQNIEVILVDDGSTDGCGEICDEYAKKDSRIRVIHKHNEGLSAARNDGITKTSHIKNGLRSLKTQ